MYIWSEKIIHSDHITRIWSCLEKYNIASNDTEIEDGMA